MRISRAVAPFGRAESPRFEPAHRHLPGGLPMGSAKDIETAKVEFKSAWEALKARTPPEQLAAAYQAMNIRNDE